MSEILEKSLILIDDIINNKEVKNLNFYESVLKIMSSLYQDNYSIGIFFLENTGYITKSSISSCAASSVRVPFSKSRSI